MKSVAIWNPASGSAPDEDKLRAALDAAVGEVDLVPTTEDDPGRGQTADAVAAGADIVVACGGDGTVRACLEPLAGTETSLAIVPLGTGNLLAGNLNIASGLKGAAGIGKGDPRRLDLGWINDEAFAVMAGSGFDALMIRDASSKVKSRFGTIAYVISGARHLRAQLVATTVTVDGSEWFRGRSSMVLVGNFGTVTGGLDVFPDAVPDDGLLDVAVLSAHSLREWLSVVYRLARGKPQKLELAQRTQGSSITVQHGKPRVYELDGEDREPTTRLDIRVQPAAIAVHHEGGK